MIPEKGKPVLVAETTGWKFSFMSLEQPKDGKPYVVVMATRGRKKVMRYYAPDRVLDPKTKLSVIE